MRILWKPEPVLQVEAKTPGLPILPRPELYPPFAPTSSQNGPQGLAQQLRKAFQTRQLAALAGGLRNLGCAGVLAVALGGCAGTLPKLDHSEQCVPVAGAPTLIQAGVPDRIGAQIAGAEEVSSLASTFANLKTIGGGPAKARLLEDNLHSWNARWAALETAQSSIDSTYFIVEKDPFGYAFLGHLLKKQREDVPVRLMIDAMADTFGKNGFKMPLRGKDYLQELAGEGSQVSIYHPISSRASKLASYAVLASNHDKLLSIDKRWSFTGGRNIAIDYYAHPDDMATAWRDTDVMLEGEGPAIAMSKAMEAELQHEKLISKVSPDRFGNWHKRDIELIGAYLIMDLWLKDPLLSATEKTSLRADATARAALAQDLVARAIARLPSENIDRTPSSSDRKFLDEVARSLVKQLEARGSRHSYDALESVDHASEVKVLDQTSAAGVRVNDFDKALVSLVRSAKHRIIIENPYVVLTEEMIQAMAEAAANGVEIYIGTNSPLSTDSAVTQAFFLEDWDYVLARVPTARIFVATGQRKLHAKAATIDDEISIVSSYNMDLLSGYVNSEIGAVIKSKSFTSRMNEVFLADKTDPKNGVVEYLIEKDAEGRAVLKDGKPIVVFGPEDHLPKEVLEDYVGRRRNWMFLRDHLPYFTPLRHPALGCETPPSAT